MKTQRRWLQSVIAASRDSEVRMPWQTRKAAKLVKSTSVTVPKSPALAAR